MVYTSPIAWSTIEANLVAWVLRATGLQAIWANQNAPQPSRPYVTLNWITGAVQLGGDTRDTSQDLTRAHHVRVTPVARDATTYTATIDGTGYDYLSDADATIAEICTGMVDAIDASGITAADDTTSWTLHHDTAGSTFLLVLSDDGPGDDVYQSFANVDEGHEIATTYRGPRNVTLSVNVYADSDAPSGSARDYASILMASLGSDTEINYRAALGMGFLGVSGQQDLSELEGSQFIHRQQFDALLSVPSNLTEQSGYVATVEITSSDLEWSSESFGG